LVLVTTAAYSVPWIAREKMRSAIYDVQTYMQLARIEAVSRNQDCRMVVDTGSHKLWVLDSAGTSTLVDDIPLYERELPESVSFARPGGGAAVTLAQIGGGDSYQTVFKSDGTVDAGVGDVVIFGGEQYGRISVFGAGSTQVEKWNNGSWHVGS
jgi:hypothetical protein